VVQALEYLAKSPGIHSASAPWHFICAWGSIDSLLYYHYPISEIHQTCLLEQWPENDLSGRINPCGYVNILII
jgi:hypothetical protein